jgi:hypothetical protein
MTVVLGVLVGWSLFSALVGVLLGCYARSLRVPPPAAHPEPSAQPAQLDLGHPLLSGSRSSRARQRLSAT